MPATPIVSACTLLTPDEAGAALKYATVIARRSPDSVREASRGESRCVFRSPPGSSQLEMVTVYVANGLPEWNQAELNAYATTMGLGETARTITGIGAPAAVLQQPPTIVAKKGSWLVLVASPSASGTRDLAMKAVNSAPLTRRAQPWSSRSSPFRSLCWCLPRFGRSIVSSQPVCR